MTARELVDEAKNVQQESLQSTNRAKQVLEHTIQIGTDTSDALKRQTDMLQNVDSNLDAIESNLKRAEKQIRVFLRRMATDKIILALLLLVVLSVVISIVVTVVRNKTTGSNDQLLTLPGIPTNFTQIFEGLGTK